jgi:hypothetical protein
MPKHDLAPKYKVPVPRSDRIFAWVLTIVVIVGMPLAAHHWPHPLWPSLTVFGGWIAGMFFGITGAWEKRT